jgi:hypothetical protein
VEIVDFGEGDNESDSIKSYCKSCVKYGFLVPLKNRIYPEGEPIPVDHENWLMCHECGLIVPVYELEKEATIKDVVETVDNPFDIAKNEFLGTDSRASAKKRKRLKDKQQDFDYINDDDLKRELKKGSTLLSYSEQLP